MLQKLKPYGGGIAVIALGVLAFFILRGNPVNDFQLMTRGATLQGIAIEVNDFEDQEDNATTKRYFFIKYEFKTPTGETIHDIVEVPGKSTDKGYVTGQSLDIQYLPETPKVHRIKSLASLTLTEWILNNLLFGLLAIAPGCYFLYRSHRS